MDDLEVHYAGFKTPHFHNLFDVVHTNLGAQLASESVIVGKAAVGNLLGGIGYFYGQSKISLPRDSNAERLKARAQERLTNKIAATRRVAEEKRANVEAKLNKKAVRTSEKADYVRRTGHLPSTFSFKLPSPCW